ncbi:D-methionine transport system permease protein [Rhodococcus percolatus]|nr:D-methionine transport system permease protein [Rhodococcus opacus]MBP2208570.1 D-methionine transport system permease protein [Rhodococcus opacus]
MVITLVVGGLIGLLVGTLLYATRKGGILQNTAAYTVLNILVNIVRRFRSSSCSPHWVP